MSFVERLLSSWRVSFIGGSTVLSPSILLLLSPLSGRDAFVSHDLLVRTPSIKERRRHTEPESLRTPSLLASMLVGASPLGTPDQGDGGLKSMLPDPSPLSSPEQGAGELKMMLPDPLPLSSPEQGAGGLKTILPDPSPLSSPQEAPKYGTEDKQTDAPANSSVREDLLGVNHTEEQTLPTSQSLSFNNSTSYHACSSQESDGEDLIDVHDVQEPLFTSATPKLTSRLDSARTAHSKHFTGRGNLGNFEPRDLLSGPSPSPLSLGGDPSIQLPPSFRGDSLDTPSQALSFLNDIQPPSPFQHAVLDLDTPSPAHASTRTHAREGHRSQEGERMTDQNGTQPAMGSLIDFTTPDRGMSTPLLTSTRSQERLHSGTSQGPGQQQSGGTLPSYLYPSKGSSTHSKFCSCVLMRCDSLHNTM